MARGADGDVVTIRSEYGVSETLDRLSLLITAKGLRVFARINHATAAAEARLKLRPTEQLVFGHPEKRTLLMQERQIVGLDLPVRALAWRDEAGRVWLSHRRVASIASWHGLAGAADAVKAIDENLAMLCAAAANGKSTVPVA
ncbi:MAG: DUF302 domain-containing protein [Verrucomicrobiota bacterium]|nr:DUF302 domain-containing protein [Verrucomicrobiota bacterium]